MGLGERRGGQNWRGWQKGRGAWEEGEANESLQGPNKERGEGGAGGGRQGGRAKGMSQVV